MQKYIVALCMLMASLEVNALYTCAQGVHSIIPAARMVATSGICRVGRIITFSNQQEKNSKSTISLNYALGRTNKILYNAILDGLKSECASEAQNLILVPETHALIGAMNASYSDHVPISLRPDDILLSIAITFSHYVNTHAREMRQYLVDHDDKKELEVSISRLYDKSPEFWDETLAALHKEITRHTNEKLEFLVPDFFTTTSQDKLAARIALMGATKAYFGFTASTCCALTQIELSGKYADWQSLVHRARQLAQFGGVLEQWSQLLVPVLEQFVAAYDGEKNLDFWERMITSKRLGSGEDRHNHGWKAVFSPFDDKGNWHLRSPEQIAHDHIYATLADEELLPSAVFAPLKLIDGSTTHAMELWAIQTPHYDPKRNYLGISTDWAIFKKTSIAPEKE